MKKILALMMAAALVLSLVACSSGGDTTSDGEGDNKSASTPSSGDANVPDNNQENTVPNNGEWDGILCSGDGYHLVKKVIDTPDKYKIMVGVVDDAGEWVHELTDKGAFVEAIQLRMDTFGAADNGDVLLDSTCYMYLGEGVFIGSPGLLVYSVDSEYKLGPWNAGSEYSYGDDVFTTGWECLFWNVLDNIQVEFKSTRMTMFRDGYALFTKTADNFGNTLSAINKKGQITELPCRFDICPPNYDFEYKFPVYSDGLFFAKNIDGLKQGFFDIEGNLVLDLSSMYYLGGIPFNEALGINAPYFENGKATILFKNNGGTVYKATIDKAGKYIGEPQKTDIEVKPMMDAQ